MNASRTISTAWVKGMAEKFEASGLDATTIFKGAGIDISSLKSSDVRYPCETVSRVWELAEKTSGNPAIGVVLGKEARAASLDIISYVMMSCPNLREGLERFVRYLRIVSEAIDITLNDTASGCEVAMNLYGGASGVPRPRIEYVMMTFLSICRWVAGRNIQPVEVDFTFAQPKDLTPYLKSFCPNLRFHARTQRIVFSAYDLTQPLPAANEALAQIHEKFAVDYLVRLESNQLSHKVRDIIVRRLPDGDPLRAKVAEELFLSERTLQRRLQEEGTTFHELVDSTRREITEQYLRGHLSLGQIAYLLGFADQSTFFRACRRWFDMSPSEYRHQYSNN